MNFYKITLTILICSFFSSGCGTKDSTSDVGADTDISALCKDFDEVGCKSQSECQPIFAQPYDFEQKCLAAKIFATCALGSDSQCNNQVSGVLEDPDGACWFQSAICSPISWKVIEEGESSRCNTVIQADPCTQD